MFQFTAGTNIYRYTSADADQTLGGFIYTAVPFIRSQIVKSPDLNDDTLVVNASRTIDFASLYIASSPTVVVSLVMQRFHEDDLGSIVAWRGRVVNVKFSGDTVEIRAEPVSTALRRNLLRRRYQLNCPHVLYDPDTCRVARTTYKQVATLTGVSSTTLTSTTFGGETDGYWVGGWVDWIGNGITNSRFVLEHSGNDIVVNIPFQGIAVSDSVDIYPGCDRTINTCFLKFSNSPNNGGFMWLVDDTGKPIQNPFTQASVF